MQGVFQMGQSLQDLEQRLLQSTADLNNRRAENQMLKDSIRVAEGFQAKLQYPKVTLAGQASPSRLVLTAD